LSFLQHIARADRIELGAGIPEPCEKQNSFRYFNSSPVAIPLHGDDILKRPIKRYGPTGMFVTGCLRFHQAATKAIGIV